MLETLISMSIPALSANLTYVKFLYFDYKYYVFD